MALDVTAVVLTPNRAVDNSSYWSDTFDREHFLDMFFSGEDEPLKGVYEEMSSGRYTVDGDVSERVTVPYNSASYGETESQKDRTRFIQDTADARYHSQIAGGNTPAHIGAYLASFDEWDRYHYDKDGDFDEADGYIDHFQAIHVGEGEEAGAASSAIWSHRWAVGQAGRGTSGPAANPFGGIRIGDSDVWIRDYTGFWTLMSSGSWLGHGDGSIGTTPNHKGAWEKLQFGWLDYDVATAGVKSTHKIGPSYHATKAPQSVVVNLPKDAAGNNRFYIAENRQYAGYDATLATGPYNFGWGITAPDTVEHFASQDGLSITYWNTAQRNNNVRQHPGAGLALPVDAHAKALTWSDGTVVRIRIQSYDATFGKQATDALSLHRELATGMMTLTAPSQPGVAVFDDTDPNAYYDAANPGGSVVVAGTGTKIEVIQSNSVGMMTVQVR